VGTTYLDFLECVEVVSTESAVLKHFNGAVKFKFFDADAVILG